MPSPKGGAAIIYGKVQIFGGQNETLGECYQQLMKILKSAGYPESEPAEVEEDDDGYEIEEELEEKHVREEEDAKIKHQQQQEANPWSKLVRGNVDE